MKKLQLLFYVIVLLWGTSAVAQVNTGNPKKPMGENVGYPNGFLPTSINSDAAISAYNIWKSKFVQNVGDCAYVKFTDKGNDVTVSEGIAYGMLLSAYAADQDLFKRLSSFFHTNKKGVGVLPWQLQVNGSCQASIHSETGSEGAATDADLDAAIAYLVAAEQWDNSEYYSRAVALIQSIRASEMWENGGNVYTMNGDTWGEKGHQLFNPSYQSPAYYRVYAEHDNADFWNKAITTSEMVLKNNANPSTGLTGNWCNIDGTQSLADKTPNEYGMDACRVPWRMATDVVWYGEETAAVAASICAKMNNWAQNDFSDGSISIAGPMPQNSPNPSTGKYQGNGAFSTFACTPLVSNNYSALNNALASVVANWNRDDLYFNNTINTLSLFFITGNFWRPGSSGFIAPPLVIKAVTNDDGTEIILTSNKTLSSGGSFDASSFELNGESNSISGISVSGSTITLTVADGSIPSLGKKITLSYNGNGGIESEDGGILGEFTKSVIMLMEGSETILDDCEDGDELNNVGGVWFTFNDEKDQKKAAVPGTPSAIAPLTGEDDAEPLMDEVGYESDYAIHGEFTLGTPYTPYNGSEKAEWENASFVGLGTWVDDEETGTMDWTEGQGVTFWYKGPDFKFQVIIEEMNITDSDPDNDNYDFHSVKIDGTTEWTKITIEWGKLLQAGWNDEKLGPVPFTAEHVQKLQWQWSTEDIDPNSTDEFFIDDIRILNMPPVAVESIDVFPKDPSISLNDLKKLPLDTDPFVLEGMVKPTDATYPIFFWSSTNENVATVDFLGEVSIVGYGEAEIIAQSKMHQEITGSATIKVLPPAVEPDEISFDPDEISIGVGEIITLNPLFSSNSGKVVNQKDVEWDSEDFDIVFVNAYGEIEGVEEGKAVITAISKTSPTVKGTITVNVGPVAVTGIDVSTDPIEIQFGESKTIEASVLPGNATEQELVWKSSDENIVTVDGGVITTIGSGVAEITVSSKENSEIKETIEITVLAPPIESISFDDQPTEVAVGGELSLDFTVTPDGASRAVKLSSANEDIAKIEDGLVVGVSAGEVKITITSDENEDLTDEITVTVKASKVTDITLNKTEAEISVGEELELKVTEILPEGADNKEVVWSTKEETDVLEVAEDGTVTGLVAGTAVVVATAADGGGATAECEVTVSAILVKKISLFETEKTLLVGEEYDIIASTDPIEPTNGTLEYTSDKEEIATVDQNGKVIAISEGTAIITIAATDESGIEAEFTVKVEAILPEVLAIESQIGLIEGGDDVTLTVTILPENASVQDVEWDVVDDGIVTVEDGVVSPVAEGTTTITATSVANSELVATCIVTVSADEVAAESIALEEKSLSLTAGDIKVLAYEFTPDNATNKTVTWKSSDEDVATVVNGVVTAIADGTAKITVTTEDGSFEAECDVNVSSVAIIGVTIDRDELTLKPGGNDVLTATVKPEDATNDDVEWISRDENVVTVINGVVIAKGVGSAYVVVKTVVGGFMDSCLVTVSSAKVEKIVATPATLNDLTTASSPVQIELDITPSDASNEVEWSSSDKDVVEVDEDGIVSVVGTGEATITATAKDGSEVSVDIPVVVSAIAVEGITITEEIELSAVGKTAEIEVEFTPANPTNQNIEWKSSDNEIVSVEDGVVTAKGEGTVKITATTEDGDFTVECEVTVLGGTSYPVKGISMDETYSMPLSETGTVLDVTFNPTNATNQSLTWETSDADVLEVDENTGELTPVATGTAKITATSVDGDFTAECEVTVVGGATTRIRIDISLDLYVGESQKLEATATPNPNVELLWKSDDENVAEVDQEGNVKAIGEGTADITAIAQDGSKKVSNKCLVTVTTQDITIKDVSVTPESSIIEVGDDFTPTLSVTTDPENADYQTQYLVRWEITDGDESAVKIVDGVVTGIKSGICTITVYVDTKSASFEVEVVDKTDLSELIDVCKDLHANAEEGTTDGKYAYGSKRVFNNAIKAAIVVLDQESTQAEINDAFDDLTEAKAVFDSKQNVSETLIFDAEIQNMTRMGTYWSSYNDHGDKANSTVIPLSSENEPFTMTAGGYDGTGYAAKIEYTLEKADFIYEPYVGMGMNLAEGQAPFDLTGSIGFSFYYKATNKTFLEVSITGITNYDNYHVELVPAAEWTFVTVLWDDENFAQYNWDDSPVVEFDASTVTQFQWKAQGADGTTGEIWVDEVTILGKKLDLPEIKSPELSALLAAIESAKTLKNNAKEGEYPDDAVQAFSSAISKAEVVAADEDATADELVDAADELAAAQQTFLDSKVTSVDKSELISKITLAKGLILSNPKSTAAKELQNVVDSSQEVVDDENASESEVKYQLALLNLAIEEFLKTDVEVLETSIIVYPNPAVSDVTVASNEIMSNITIIGTNGSIVKTVEANAKSASIDVSGLATGIYKVSIVMANGTIAEETILVK